jgi:hypothetical protein
MVRHHADSLLPHEVIAAEIVEDLQGILGSDRGSAGSQEHP